MSDIYKQAHQQGSVMDSIRQELGFRHHGDLSFTRSDSRHEELTMLITHQDSQIASLNKELLKVNNKLDILLKGDK